MIEKINKNITTSFQIKKNKRENDEFFSTQTKNSPEETHHILTCSHELDKFENYQAMRIFCCAQIDREYVSYPLESPYVHSP